MSTYHKKKLKMFRVEELENVIVFKFRNVLSYFLIIKIKRVKYFEPPLLFHFSAFPHSCKLKKSLTVS